MGEQHKDSAGRGQRDEPRHATRRLKTDPATRAILIIALAAHAMADDRDKALKAGCDGYNTKPIELPRLLEKIETPLGAGRPGRSSTGQRTDQIACWLPVRHCAPAGGGTDKRSADLPFERARVDLHDRGPNPPRDRARHGARGHASDRVSGSNPAYRRYDVRGQDSGDRADIC